MWKKTLMELVRKLWDFKILIRVSTLLSDAFKAPIVPLKRQKNRFSDLISHSRSDRCDYVTRSDSGRTGLWSFRRCQKSRFYRTDLNLMTQIRRRLRRDLNVKLTKLEESARGGGEWRIIRTERPECLGWAGITELKARDSGECDDFFRLW